MASQLSTENAVAKVLVAKVLDMSDNMSEMFDCLWLHYKTEGSILFWKMLTITL